MPGKSETYTVKDGRIRITCPRCAKKKYLAIPAGVRKKMVRCVCGMSMTCTLNHRTSTRESVCSKAMIILQSGKECPVYLCDISLAGIGFNIPNQYTRSVTVGQEIIIKFRSTTGSSTQRRIRIKSIINARAGAEFTDKRIPSF